MGRQGSSPPRLDGVSGMDYEPENEQGVVYLFALLHRDLGFRGIERIRAGFPDCIARRRVKGEDHSVNIEFEYESRDFVSHKHLEQMKERGVRRVTVVCWDHNWDAPPANVEVLSLKEHLGIRRVWVMATRETESYTRFLDRREKTTGWSLPTRSRSGDLVLMYRTATAKAPGRIEDLVKITARDPRPDPQWGPYGKIRKVAKLTLPLTVADFQDHFTLGRSALSKAASYQSRRDVTAYWPDIYRLIVKRNPKVARALREWHPRFI